MKMFRSHLLICGGTGCHASGSISVKESLINELNKKKLAKEIQVIETGCNGFCAMGPIIVVYPEGIIYMQVHHEDIRELVEEHFIKGRIVKRLLYKEPGSEKVIAKMSNIPFFANQELRVLKNKGLIDPENIEEYIARDGYAGMAKALTEMNSNQIIQELLLSGLRGRGGAGFLTGLKWQFAAKSPGNIKYVLCNADEGDPGAFMDRSILEADPHSIIEGMIIAAKAIGASKGYIYCRAEYPLAIKRMNIALKQANEKGLLGNNILFTGFNFDISIYQGAGAFVCGEETALMTSIEGKRGMPRSRPPFPAVSGLWEKPSILNNVETISNIGQIILKGGQWYASIGTEKSKGTKVFALTGDINNVGLVEVPMGTKLGDIVYNIGGGIPKSKAFKAAQLGGPSGGMIPIQHLNAPIDYEKVTELGAIMGSGGLIVLNEDKCAVDMARFFMDFCQDESCGKCTPCREGTKRMLDILTNICKGKGKEGDIELLEEMADIIKNTALCGLGQTAPNPVLSTLRYFRNEYNLHIKEKKCSAAVCTELFNSPCQHACPIGMDIPAYIALIQQERFIDAYKILLKTNPFPSVCGRVCDHQCQSKCRRSMLDESVAIKFLKRFITDNALRPEINKIPITRKEKIAIIGSGPAGLTFAKNLALRGYSIVIFEELPEAGGMLRYGIPSYRLPRNILKNEIESILSLGIQINYNTKIGKNLSFKKLTNDFDYIYIASGAHKSQSLNIEGENLIGVYGGVEFLRDFNLNKNAWFGSKKQKTLGNDVIVIGGGNSAIDAARCAIRLGVKKVTILYRRLRQDMPAAVEEILAAEHEGVKIEYLVAPIKIIGNNGKTHSIICQKMKLGDFDSSGRKRPIPIPNSEFIIPASSIISAIGQIPDLDYLKQEKNEIIINKWSCIELVQGSKSKTNINKIYAGGDVVNGASTVVKAIQAGKEAANELDLLIRMLNKENLYQEPTIDIEIPFDIHTNEETEEKKQIAMPEINVIERKKTFDEVEIGFNKIDAINEAARCLRCDVKVS